MHFQDFRKLVRLEQQLATQPNPVPPRDDTLQLTSEFFCFVLSCMLFLFALILASRVRADQSDADNRKSEIWAHPPSGTSFLLIC